MSFTKRLRLFYFLFDGKNFSGELYDNKKYPKYSWVELDLVRHPADFRLESYMPRNGLDEPIRFIDKIATDDYWAARKEYVCNEVFTSMEKLISLSKSEDKSLGTLKPLKITDFIIERTERNWKPQWLEKLKQLSISRSRKGFVVAALVAF